MTVEARGVSTLCWHAALSIMYTRSTAAEAEHQGNKKRTGCRGAGSPLGIRASHGGRQQSIPPALRLSGTTAYGS
eukprot:8193806-Pyramimonas_sp.AAC.1